MSKLPLGHILLVEDSIGDIKLTQEAMKENKMQINLHVVMDGEEAIEYLHKRGKYSNEPRPDLILLDLNLPKKDGREVLKEIKADAQLSTIPVVVLTISKSDQDIQQAYLLHANCYIVKPLDLNEFIEIIRQIENFWFSVVTLPKK